MKDPTARFHARTLVDRLRASTSRCADLETLAQAIFETVAADVPFGFACLATTDPTSGLINSTYKSHPLAMGEDDFAAAEYGAPDINLFTDLAQRPLPVGVLSIDTDGHPDRCRRLREFMGPQFGFTDEIRLVCRNQSTTWGLLAIYRDRDQPTFTAAEGKQVATVHPVIADAVRRTVFAAKRSGSINPGPFAVLIVDIHNQLTDTTQTAAAMIDELGGWDHGSLPASVLFVVFSSRMTGQPAEGRVLGRSGTWLRVRAVALTGPTPNRSVALTIETADATTVGQMVIAARGLTAREQEVVGLILQGASTKDIAGTLHLSPHTVQDHLKAIFTKLNVTSRRELIGQFALT
ncbi:MAG: helix-turn-helix transcriptional regulator [Antricoccus sp.]